MENQTANHEAWLIRRNKILAMKQSGMTYNQIGDHFGVSDSAVQICVVRHLRKEKKPCEKCGTTDGRIGVHHESYVPEIVHRLCVRCHQLEHSDDKRKRLHKWAKKFTIGGYTKTLSEWSAATGIRKVLLWDRVVRGVPIENLLAEPKRGNILGGHTQPTNYLLKGTSP